MKKNIKIIEVTDKKYLKKFLALTKSIYQKGSPNYIAPLHIHLKMMLGKLKEENKCIFLALNEDDQPVARLATKVHHCAGESFLHFGFYECQKGQEDATNKLIAQAHSKHPNLKMMGPYHFVMEDPYIGTLVHGFDQTPYVFMPYNQQYYDSYLQQAGLSKSMDLLTYLIPITSCPAKITKIAERSSKRGYQVRWFDPKKLKQEVKTIAGIFNNALSENWGFEPITDIQLDEMYMIFQYVIDPKVVCFVEKNGVEIGCCILLPNLNPLIKTANGHLSLSFLWKILTQRKNYDSVRGYALGIRKEHHGSGIVCQLIDSLYRRALSLNLKECEISWVLENNRPMTQLSESIGGVHNKTYRVYEKEPLVTNSKTA